MEHLEELWNNVLAQVEQKISKPSFETWLKSTKLLSYNGSGSTVTIAAPNSFLETGLKIIIFI
ncbi:Chromosomal replication initiator protein DnaA OS=Lysinibacillus sphaericus OX=1421 GN=dnaA_2 PE=3 SV=1 [Lysinibacillus sphaericus]